MVYKENIQLRSVIFPSSQWSRLCLSLWVCLLPRSSSFYNLHTKWPCLCHLQFLLSNQVTCLWQEHLQSVFSDPLIPIFLWRFNTGITYSRTSSIWPQYEKWWHFPGSRHPMPIFIDINIYHSLLTFSHDVVSHLNIAAFLRANPYCHNEHFNFINKQ